MWLFANSRLFTTVTSWKLDCPAIVIFLFNVVLFETNNLLFVETSPKLIVTSLLYKLPLIVLSFDKNKRFVIVLPETNNRLIEESCNTYTFWLTLLVRLKNEVDCELDVSTK